MDAYSLLPATDALPAPWWLFEILGAVTFFLHLLFANIVVGGTLLVLAARLRGRDPGGVDDLASSVYRKLPTGTALTINMGVAPLLFVQVVYGHLLYSSSVVMATWWLLVIPLLIVAYYGAYIHTRRNAGADALTQSALVVSALCLLYIAFIFVNNMTMSLQPETWTRHLAARDGRLLNLADSTLWPRYLHFLVAAVAVSGLFAALLWSRRRGVDEAVARQRVHSGLRLFAIATAVQLAVGCWFLVALPAPVRDAMLGGNGVHTAVLGLGVALGIAAMVTAFVGQLASTVGLLLGTVLVMVVNRALVRSAYIGDFFDPGSMALQPQYGVMALFLVIFVIGLASVAYMHRLAAQASGREVAS